MKVRVFLGVAIASVFGLGVPLVGGQAIDPDQMGLSPFSVFEVPEPDVFAFPDTRPGDAGTLPRGFPGAPPQIPHAVDEYLPITLSRNRCAGCHDDFEMIGKELGADDPTPMPLSHYMEVGGRMVHSGEAQICIQCHQPQADVPPLVGSTF